MRIAWECNTETQFHEITTVQDIIDAGLERELLLEQVPDDVRKYARGYAEASKDGKSLSSEEMLSSIREAMERGKKYRVLLVEDER